MYSQVPNKAEQMVRYYGYYSNVSRGERKKEVQDAVIPSILEPDGSFKEYRKIWARLIPQICASAIDFNNKSLAEKTTCSQHNESQPIAKHTNLKDPCGGHLQRFLVIW